MDPVLLATLIGGSLTLVGTIAATLLSNYFSLRKERELWQRQQAAEKEKYERERKELDRKALQEVYSNLLHHLSLFIDTGAESFAIRPIDPLKAPAIHREQTHRWLAQYLVMSGSGDGYQQGPVKVFIEATTDHEALEAARELRKEMFFQAMADDRLRS